jgi:hypothetical protein
VRTVFQRIVDAPAQRSRWGRCWGGGEGRWTDMARDGGRDGFANRRRGDFGVGTDRRPRRRSSLSHSLSRNAQNLDGLTRGRFGDLKRLRFRPVQVGVFARVVNKPRRPFQHPSEDRAVASLCAERRHRRRRATKLEI